MSKNKQDSGSVHMIIMAIIIILILAVLGFLFWKNFVNKPVEGNSLSKSNTTEKTTPVKNSEVIPIENTVMSRYVNYQQGFEFQFPNIVQGSTGCSQVSTVYDRYGNSIPSQPHYQATTGAASTTVLESDNRYIITTEKTDVLTDIIHTDDGHALAQACTMRPMTAALVDFDNNLSADTYVNNGTKLEIDVSEATNNDEITKFIKKAFSDNQASIDKIGALQGGRQEVTIKYGPDARYPNGAYLLWYYPAQEKLVFINLGQSVHLISTDVAGKYYDQDVTKSFQLITK